MSTVTVSGFTTSDIASACASAGSGGTVFFPNGTYTADGLQNTVADQTWQLERYAVLQKPQTSSQAPIIANLANGWRLRGGKITDSAGNTTPNGINTVGYSTDIAETEVNGVRGSAIVAGNAEFKLRDVEIHDPLYFGCYWNATSTMRGPRIDDVLVYKAAGSNPQSGIAVRAAGPNVWHQGTRISNCYISMASGQIDSSVGIDVWQGHQPCVYGNDTLNGRIAFSFYLCQFGRFFSNFAFAPADYAYELAALSYSDLSHNTGRGWGPGLNYFLELSNGTVWCNITDNRPIGFAENLHAQPDCVNNTIR